MPSFEIALDCLAVPREGFLSEPQDKWKCGPSIKVSS